MHREDNKHLKRLAPVEGKDRSVPRPIQPPPGPAIKDSEILLFWKKSPRRISRKV